MDGDLVLVPMYPRSREFHAPTWHMTSVFILFISISISYELLSVSFILLLLSAVFVKKCLRFQYGTGQSHDLA